MTGWWRGLDRADRILVGLALAGLAIKVWMYLGIAGGPLVGDEKYYLDSGKGLANALRDLVSLTSPDRAEFDRALVGSGWFMPGMSVVLAPLFLVLPDASLDAARLYLGTFSTVFFLATVLRVRRVLGVRAAGALLVLPGLVPTFHAFGLAAWGDTTAGLVIVLLVCSLTEVFRSVRGGDVVTWRQGAVLGWWSILAVYFRSSVSILVVGLCGVLFVAVLVAGGRATWARTVGAFAVSGAVFLGVLAPWSLVASAALDGPVLTTTSLPTVRANTFGDRDALCFGECDIGSTIWFSPLRYSRETGAAAGVSEMAVAEEMSAYALRDVTPHSYAVDVGINAGRYLGRPARFVTLLHNPDSPVGVVLFAQVLTYPLFYAAMLGVLVLLGATARRSLESAFGLLVIKAGIVLLLVQPFVHISGPRYWTTLLPLVALGFALLWGLRDQRRDDVAPADGALADGALADGALADGALARVLVLGQRGVGLLALLAVVTTAVLALVG